MEGSVNEQFEHGHVTVDLGERPFVRIVVPRTGDVVMDAENLDRAIQSVVNGLGVTEDDDTDGMMQRLRDAVLGSPAPSQQRPQQGSQRPQRGQQGGRGGRQQQGGAGPRESRADRYLKWDGEECDICGGDVGLYPKTGRMRTDKLVCLGRCMDDGRFVHTVRFLDDSE
jgi:hypothetical protein